MSGIYIKGIPMPERGNPIGVLIYPDGTAEWPARDIVGTAIPVPDHGRLIDADALSSHCKEMQGVEWNNKAAPYSWAYAYESFEDDIDNAPTIIPTDKEEA